MLPTKRSAIALARGYPANRRLGTPPARITGVNRPIDPLNVVAENQPDWPVNRGARTGVRIMRTSMAAKAASKAAVNFASRSRMRNRK